MRKVPSISGYGNIMKLVKMYTQSIIMVVEKSCLLLYKGIKQTVDIKSKLKAQDMRYDTIECGTRFQTRDNLSLYLLSN